MQLLPKTGASNQIAVLSTLLLSTTTEYKQCTLSSQYQAGNNRFTITGTGLLQQI